MSFPLKGHILFMRTKSRRNFSTSGEVNNMRLSNGKLRTATLPPKKRKYVFANYGWDSNYATRKLAEDAATRETKRRCDDYECCVVGKLLSNYAAKDYDVPDGKEVIVSHNYPLLKNRYVIFRTPRDYVKPMSLSYALKRAKKDAHYEEVEIMELISLFEPIFISDIKVKRKVF